MSIRHLADALDNSPHEKGELLVHIALANCADSETGECWPSVAELMRKSRLEERATQYALRALQESGSIEVVRKGGMIAGQKRATTYRVKLRGANNAPVSDRGAKTDKQGCSALHPNHQEENRNSIYPRDVDLLGLGAEGVSSTILLTSKTPAELFPTMDGDAQTEFYNAWNDFAADRAERKCALTTRAAATLLKKLQQRPEQAALALRIAVERGWRGFEWEWIEKTPTNKTARNLAQQREGRPLAVPRMKSSAQQRGAQ